MTDEQIERLIFDEIKRRGITLYDMIGLVNENIDPNPEDKTMPANKRARRNRFQSVFGCDRMEELLCVGEYNPYDFLPPLKVTLQDLFRFWWNRCVEKELVVEEVLEDIFAYFTEKMRPPEKETENMDMEIDFIQLSFFSKDIEEAA